MHALCGPVAALAVASIYCVYRAYLATLASQKRTLHERVAYMLWTAAQQIEE
jgi:hypothetical protein